MGGSKKAALSSFFPVTFSFEPLLPQFLSRRSCATSLLGKTNGARTWDKRRERSEDLSAGPVYCYCRQRHTPDILFEFKVLGPGPKCYRHKHFVWTGLFVNFCICTAIQPFVTHISQLSLFFQRLVDRLYALVCLALVDMYSTTQVVSGA